MDLPSVLVFVNADQIYKYINIYVHVYNIILRPLNYFTDFFDICNKQMLIYNYIIFGQLFVKDCVNYKQCLISLQTARVYIMFMYIIICLFIVKDTDIYYCNKKMW